MTQSEQTDPFHFTITRNAWHFLPCRKNICQTNSFSRSRQVKIRPNFRQCEIRRTPKAKAVYPNSVSEVSCSTFDQRTYVVVHWTWTLCFPPQNRVQVHSKRPVKCLCTAVAWGFSGPQEKKANLANRPIVGRLGQPRSSCGCRGFFLLARASPPRRHCLTVHWPAEDRSDESGRRRSWWFRDNQRLQSLVHWRILLRALAMLIWSGLVTHAHFSMLISESKTTKTCSVFSVVTADDSGVV